MADMEDLLAVGCLILAVLFNSVLLLSNFWSVKANEFFGYAQLKDGDIANCTHVKVQIQNHKAHTVKRFIVPLNQIAVEFAPGKVNKANEIEVQKKKFIYSSEKKTFSQIPYPVNETIEFYQYAEGLETEQEVKKAHLVLGPNKMSIPIPQFHEIYKEHMVAPFFIFQLFTNALWLLDEYWYYSLMSLVMLFMFEGTVVF